MRFEGKVVVVTSGSSEIGRACALGFTLRSASVALLDRDREGGEATVNGVREKGAAARRAGSPPTVRGRASNISYKRRRMRFTP
jgi:NAD(P)-dependent dehydrogenase (short-subunit alcohol dehydrogenase family)